MSTFKHIWHVQKCLDTSRELFTPQELNISTCNPALLNSCNSENYTLTLSNNLSSVVLFTLGVTSGASPSTVCQAKLKEPKTLKY